MGKDSSVKKRKKDGTSGKISSSTLASRKRKTSDSSTAGTTVAFYQEYCELPYSLRTMLVDEFNYITRKGFDSPHGYDCEMTKRPARSVHDLPAKVTVRQVLQHYQRKRACLSNDNNKDGDDDDEKLKKQQQHVRKFCEGLALLFDDALPVCLLYAEERPQYESLQYDDDLKLKRPCEVYGSTFLLRLLVRLPQLLVAEPQSEMYGTLAETIRIGTKHVLRSPEVLVVLQYDVRVSKLMMFSVCLFGMNFFHSSNGTVSG
jgi:hypothetical protein